jgi:hypothetical protein
MTENIRDWLPLIVFVFLVVSLTISSVVITFHHFNRGIRRIVLAREMAMEYIHVEVPEMRSYL